MAVTENEGLNKALKVYHRLFNNESRGWYEVIAELTIINIKADHLSLMLSPFVEDVARLIESHL